MAFSETIRVGTRSSWCHGGTTCEANKTYEEDYTMLINRCGARWLALAGFAILPLTAEVLSNNLSNPVSGTQTASGSTLIAASFKTGASAYNLDSVTLLLANPSPGQVAVSIHSDASGQPGQLVATLTSPANLSSSATPTTFTANGVMLAANSTYWVALRSLSGTFDWSWSSNNTGEGAGFTHMYAVSNNAGTNWFTFNVNQPLMTVNATQGTGTCNYTLSPTSLNAPAAAGTGSITVTAGSSCQATVTSSTDWIAITSGNSMMGSGTVTFSYSANQGAQRVGTITIGGQAFNVTQAGGAGTGCTFSVSPTTLVIPPGGGNASVTVTTGAGCNYTATSSMPWLNVVSGSTGSGSGTVNVVAPANSGTTPLSATLTIGGQTVQVTQASNVCNFTVAPTTANVAAAGGTATFTLTGQAGCTWNATTTSPWLTVLGSSSGTGNATITVQAQPNAAGQRTGNVTIGGQTVSIVQGGGTCDITLSSSGANYGATGGTATINVTTGAGCVYTATSDSTFVTITSGSTGSGSGTISYTVLPLSGASARTATITIGGVPFVIQQNTTTQTGLLFVPIMPCRIADTRLANGPFGGPALQTDETRNFTIPASGCNIPANAAAYALNLTVVPSGPLAFATLWPTGQGRPNVSTLNSFDGRIKANAAIVMAGTGGAVSVYATSPTDVVLDINGYFIPASAGGNGLAFYPITPCRVSDTRLFNGPLGGPMLMAGVARNVPVQSACGLPSTAQAYSLNVTAVPRGPLGFLTIWPSNQSQPLVSTLNAPTGQVVANAAIVRAGTSGDLSVFASNDTDLVIDVNGYFAPPAAGGLSFYATTPCRVADTRLPAGDFGGPMLGGGQARSFTVPNSSCSVPTTAQAYALNATVVPQGVLDYLTLWGTGQGQPFVSTLNSFDASVVSNAAIVPAGTAGAITAFATRNTELVLDINGYFAP